MKNLIYLLFCLGCLSCSGVTQQPVFKDSEGNKIVISYVESTRYAKGYLLFTTPVIKMNKEWMNSLPEDMQEFVIYHEVGHHALGHFYKEVEECKRQYEADCYALIELGADPEEVGEFLVSLNVPICPGRIDNLHYCEYGGQYSD